MTPPWIGGRRLFAFPPPRFGRASLIAALGHLGRIDEAQPALAEAQSIRPEFSISFLEKNLPLEDDDYMAHYVDGLRKAGVPEE